MKNKAIKIAAYTICGIIVFSYLLFLAVPYFVNGIVKAHIGDIEKIIEDTTNFKANFEGIRLVTTPKLTIGLEVEHANIKLPDNSEFLSSDNFQIKLSLIPLFVKRIELDKISVDNSKITFGINKYGRFLIEDAIQTLNFNSQNNTAKDKAGNRNITSGLPFGIKLSNKLPNIYLNNYVITFVDTSNCKQYSLNGNKFNVTDFILDKKVKIKANGEIVFDGEKQFSYDVKVNNQVMPDINLNDIIFAESVETKIEDNEKTDRSNNSGKVNSCKVVDNMLPFNIIDIFEAIHKNQLAANVFADIKTSGTFDDIQYNGIFKIDGMTVAIDGNKLPEGTVNATFKGNKTTFDSIFYTSTDESESSTINGIVETGKNPKFSMHLLSNAEINNLIKIIDSLAKSFGINDFDTLSATGQIDANFDISGDKKSVKSSGYLKIPTASIKYGLYDILIDKINADADLSDNNVYIKDISFTVLDQPLKIFGELTSDAVADLHLTADKLLLKALLATTGQISILKENKFNSGTLSMDATLKGKLTSPVPAVSLSIDNVNIENIPTDTAITLAKSTIDIKTDGKTFAGNINANSASVINPLATIKLPSANVTIDDKDIRIADGYITLDNSKIDITGGIYNYTKKLNIDLSAKGNIAATDLKNIIPKEFRIFVGEAKGQLPLNTHITGDIQTQNIDVNLTATPDNYFRILDIETLKGRNTTIKSSMKLANDNLKFSDTGIYTDTNTIATLSGAINNLSKTQNLDLNLTVPEFVKMPIPSFSNKSLVNAKGNISIGGTPLKPTLKGNIAIPEIKIPEMLVTLSNLEITLNGALANGKATLSKLVSSGIIAENLTSDFTFNPATCILYLKNIYGTAFKGKVKGDVSYNTLNGKIGVNFEGSGLDAITAIEGAAGIKNALSGTLGFEINVTLSGTTDTEMIKNLKGNMSFDITDGALISIGKIENLVSAGNVTSNIIMKAAIASLSSIQVIKESANFKYIKGSMTFNDGWANLTSIKTSGPSMAYYITGKYNILNGTTNVIILGRLGSDVVAALGPIGQLSADKLTSYIPKFGAATASILNSMTSNPKNENINEIPQLSNGNEVYKDFKVNFNGGIDSSNSIKSFKWLSNPDMSAINSPTLKEQILQNKDNIKTDVSEKLETIKTIKEQSSENIKNELQNVKDSVNELKNLFKF